MSMPMEFSDEFLAETSKTGIFMSEIRVNEHLPHQSAKVIEKRLLQNLMQFVGECISDGRDYTVRFFPVRYELEKDERGFETGIFSQQALITVSYIEAARIGDVVVFKNWQPEPHLRNVIRRDDNSGLYQFWEKQEYGHRLVKVSEKAI